MTEPLKPCPFCGGKAECVPLAKGCRVYAVLCTERYDGKCMARQWGAWTRRSLAVAAWNKRAEPAPERRFPIQAERGNPAPLSVPWSVAELAYSQYAARYGTRQSLERLAERGGFAPSEMDELYPAWREPAHDEVRKAVDLLVETWPGIRTLKENGDQFTVCDAMRILIDAVLDSSARKGKRN